MGFRVCVVVGGLCPGISWRENEIVKRGKIHEGVSLGGFHHHHHHCSPSISAGIRNKEELQQRTVVRRLILSFSIHVNDSFLFVESEWE